MPLNVVTHVIHIFLFWGSILVDSVIPQSVYALDEEM
jgi:hypothetical protein